MSSERLLMIFNYDATTIEEAKECLKNISTLLLKHDMHVTHYEIIKECVVAYYISNKGIKYQIIYILKQNRGNGLYMDIYNQTLKYITITMEDCHIEKYLRYKDISYLKIYFSNEYNAINKFYHDRVASRSKIFLMNHIDEGLWLIRYFSTTTNTIEAQDAFCLHPLVQGDSDLFDFYQNFNDNVAYLDNMGLFLAMEYRNIANSYLSDRVIKSVDDIKLSPLAEVNTMLIADKIQNYKDFIIYHKDSHPRLKELDLYFNNWLDKLNISKEKFQECF